MKKISICIPTYNLGENSLIYLKESFDSINAQTYPNIEVSISDNSIDDYICDYVKRYKFKEDIVVSYCKSDRGRGWGAAPNTNNSVDQSTGEYIKILLQDDKFYSDNALELIVDALKTSEWCAVKSNFQQDTNHIYYTETGNYPVIREDHPKSLLLAMNSIGGPSSVAFRKTKLRMDESIRWLNDADFYYRLWNTCGPPTIIDSETPLITLRARSGALSDTIPRSEQLAEIAFLANKHYNDIK
tara:strand:+ start:94 stop:822 length:729 start_codon:yes stop_codon:yes gene_type:complete